MEPLAALSPQGPRVPAPRGASRMGSPHWFRAWPCCASGEGRGLRDGPMSTPYQGGISALAPSGLKGFLGGPEAAREAVPQASIGAFSRTIQMPGRSCNCVWIRPSSCE